MTLHIDLAPELEARLREQATMAGKDVAELAREALGEKFVLRQDTGGAAGSVLGGATPGGAVRVGGQPLAARLRGRRQPREHLRGVRGVSTLLDTNILV